MKKYVDRISIENIDKTLNEINHWKKNLLNELKNVWYLKYQWVWYLVSFGISLIVFLICWFIFPFVLISVVAGLVLFAGLSLIVFFVIQKQQRRLLKEGIRKYNINPYTQWIFDSNQYIFRTQYQDAIMNDDSLYARYKYKIKGQRSHGLKSAYDIISGNLFHNEFKLTCGIWESSTTTYTVDSQGRSVSHTEYFYEYMPLIRVKTNLFPNQFVQITNSRNFGNFTKKDIQFENDQFNKMFSVVSSDENTARMIITPLIQDLWISERINSMEFNIVLENGHFNFLFKPRGSFMDINQIGSLASIHNIDQLVLNDLEAFFKGLEILFSISILQFETQSVLEPENKNI